MEQQIFSADLFITEECNMKCKYCFHQEGKTRCGEPNLTMSIDEGKKILDRLYQLYPERMTINFFGGEPLLYPDTVVALGRYAKSLWKDKAFFFISTNGTIFDEKLFKEFQEIGIPLQVSFDGATLDGKIKSGESITLNTKENDSVFIKATVGSEKVRIWGL